MRFGYTAWHVPRQGRWYALVLQASAGRIELIDPRERPTCRLQWHPPPPPPPPREKSGSGSEPVRALLGTARRLRAGFSALFLITLTAALAPQVAQAVTITLTATPGPAQVTLTWSTSSPPAGRIRTNLAYRPSGGSYQYRTPGSHAASGSYTLTGLTPGTTYQFFLTNNWSSHGQETSNVVSAVPLAPTRGVTVSKTSLTVDEGSTGTYTVRLDAAPDGTVTVTPRVQHAANASVDPTSLTFTTSDWSSAQTVTVNGLADEDVVTNTLHIFHDVTAAGTNYASVTAPRLELTVTDTTPTLQLLTDPAAVTEGTAISLTVTSNKARMGDLTVSLTLSDRGSSGFDADDIPGTLGPRNFTASFGNTAGTTGTVTIPTSTDSTAESAEAYRITLNDGTGYAVGDDVTADGTLNDPPQSTALSIADVSAAEDGTFTFTVTAAPASSSEVTFKYTVTAESTDTATADTDFTSVTTATAATIAANASSTTITVSVTDDALDEADETFTVTLSEPSSGVTLGDATATGTITDNDDPPALSIAAPAAVTEGDSGSADMTFTVTLDAASGRAVTVDYAVDASSTATAGTDFTDLSGMLTFAAGETSKTITVSVTGDELDEDNETVVLKLSNAGNASIGTATASGTITDDDDPAPATPGVTVSVSELTVTESSTANYTVVLDTQPAGTVTVTPTSDDTGAATVSGPLTFTRANWDRARTVTLTAAPDGDTDDESVTVSHAVTGYGSVSAVPSVSVTVTDTTPTLSLTHVPAAVTEGAAIRLTVTSDKALAGGLAVNLTLEDRDTSGFDANDIRGALGPRNFIASFGAALSTTGTVTIPTRTDYRTEGQETYRITLNEGAGYAVDEDNNTADGTLNDGTPALGTGAIALIVEDKTAPEGETMSFTVMADPAPSSPITFKYTVTAESGDTATAGSDFTAVTTAATATIAANATSTTIIVSLLQDTEVEGDETFTVTLSEPSSGATITDATATGTIGDDDEGIARPTSLRITAAEDAITLRWTARTDSEIDKWQYRFKNKERSWRGWNPFDVRNSTASTRSVTLNKRTTLHGGVGQYQVRAVTVVPIRPEFGGGEKETFGPWSELAEVSVVNTDNLALEFSGSQITRTGGTRVAYNASVAQGASITYGVRLSNAALPYVGHPVEVTLKSGSGVRVSPSSLAFTRGNARTVQPVTITGVAAGRAPIDHAVRFPALALLDPAGTISVTVTPARSYGVTISPTWLRMDEGGSGEYTVKLDAAPSANVTVTVEGDSGEVTADPSSLTFTPSNFGTAQTVTVNAGSDEDTSNDTATLTHAASSSDTNYGSSLSITAVDVTVTDTTPTLQLLTPLKNVMEGNDISLTVTSDRALTGNRTVSLTLAPYESSGFDADDIPGPLGPRDFTASFGETASRKGTVTIPTSTDSEEEEDETYTVTLNDGTGYALGARKVTSGALLDGTLPPGTVGLSIADVTAAEDGTFTFTVTASPAPSSEATFTYDVREDSGDTATAGTDFTKVTATATIAANASSTTITVTVADDALDEADETFTVQLSNPSSGVGISDYKATGTITDNDDPPALAIVAPAAVVESDSGDTAMTFTVTLDAASGRAVTVDYAVDASSTATANTDFLGGAGTLTFAAGDTSESILVIVKGDELDEADETVVLKLSNAGNASIATATASGTITDDDAAPALSIVAPAAVTEGDGGSTDMVFTVTLDAASGLAVTVDYAVDASSTATAGTDFTDLSGTLSFAAGETSKSITVAVTGDEVDEPNETVVLKLSNAGNASIATATASGTITDDDDPAPGTPGVTISKAALTIDEGGSGEYTVKLNTEPSANVTVTVGGTSVAVTVDPPSLTFTPVNYSTAQTVTVNAGTDEDTTNDTATLTHTASSTDTNYGSSLAINDVSVTVTDTTPTLQLLTDPAAVSEGTAISLTVTSDRNLTGDVTVNLTLADRETSGFDADDIAGALGPRDFTASFGTTAGRTGTVSIATVSDVQSEGAETYRITLNDGTGYAPGIDKTADGTLNDSSTSAVPGSPTGFTATAGDGSVTLSWNNPNNASITGWQYQQKTGSAAYGEWTDIDNSDATTTSHTVPGLTNGTVYRFRVRAQNANGAGAQSGESSAVTPNPVVSFSKAYQHSPQSTTVCPRPESPPPDDRVEEGFALTLEVTRSSFSAAQTLPVEFEIVTTTMGATGRAVDLSTSLSTLASMPFGLNDRRRCYSVGIAKDLLVEPNEKLVLRIKAKSGYVVSSTQAERTITIEDGTNGGIRMAWREDATLTPGAATGADVMLYAGAPVGSDSGTVSSTDCTWSTDTTFNRRVTVPWRVSSSKQATLADFEYPAAVTFVNGVATVTFKAKADADTDAETFGLEIDTPVLKTTEGINNKYCETSQTATANGLGNFFFFEGTISAPPEKTVSVPSRLLVAESAGDATVTVTASQAFGKSVTFDVTYSGTATGASDPANGDYDNDEVTSVAFGPSDTTKDIVIPITDDDVDDDDEIIIVTISVATGSTLPAGFTLSNASTTVSITDDEASTVSVPATLSVTEGTDENAVVTVTASRALGASTTFNVTYGGTATGANDPANGDYDNDAVTSVAFGPSDTMKTITIPLTDDDVDEDDETITVTISLSQGSELPEEFMLGNSTTTVTIADNEASTVSVPATLSVTEGTDENAVVTVTASKALGASTTFNVTYGDSGATGAAIPANGDYDNDAVTSVSFGAAETSKEITIPITDDDRDESDESFTVTISASGQLPSGFTLSTATTTVTITDDDTAGVTVTPSAVTVAEGASETYTVTLNTEPSAAVTITVGGASGDVTASPTALTFTTGTWGTAQTVTVAAGEDDDAVMDDAVTLTHTAAGGGYASTTIDSVTVTITEADMVGVTVTPSAVTVAEGASETYTVTLNTEPSAAVTITVGGESGDVTASPTALTFTTGTWGTAQTVTVAAGEDDDAVMDDAVTLTHTAAGGGYASTTIGSVTVTITEADAVGVTVTPSAVTVAEGASETYTVTLNTEPSAAVTITVGGASGDVTASPTALTFTTGTWGTAQTVTVAAGEDDDAVMDDAVTLTHNATSGDATYAGTVIEGMTVTITEADTVGVTVTPSAVTVAEGASETYTVTLNTEPSAAVTITVGGASGDVTASPTALTFTTGTWGTAQTVTVAAGEDDDAVTDPVVTLTHTAAGGDYAGTTINSVTAATTEKDLVGVTVSDPTPPTIAEAAGPAHTATYTVGLATEPSGSVTVTVTPGAGVTVTPGALTFTTGTWGTAQTVTVTAVDDRVDDGASKEVTVAHRSAGGGGYAGVSVRTLTFTVTDDDPPVPAKPENLTATPGDGQVALTWDDPGDASITAWQVRQQVGAGSYGAWTEIPGAVASTTSHLVTGLTNGTAYTFQVRAVNRTGAGAASDEATATPRDDDGPANAVHRAVLPQVAAVMVSESLEAVADRIEVVAAGKAGSSLQLGAQPSAPGPVGPGGRRPVREPGPSLAEVLDGVAFTLPLGSGEDGGLPPLAVWGRGARVAVAGSDHAVSWDGGVWGAHLGADLRLRPDLLAGVVTSYSLGAFDAVHTGRVRTTTSTYETDLTAVQPYVAWLGSDGSSLWASAGYGWGEVRLEEVGRAARRTDLTLVSTAVGGRGVLGEDAEWIAGGMTRLAIKGEGSAAWMETEAGDGLAGLAVDTRRLRLALQGSHERVVAGGATLTPAVELGLRHDGGDVTQGAGMEAGAILRYRDPGTGLTVEVRTRTLLVHERDWEEWGVSGLVSLDPAADGRGLFLTLAPERGGTASGLGQLFERTPGVALAPGGGGPVASRLSAEVGHGFGVTGWGRLAVVTPYAGVTLVERGERHWRLGTRYLVGGLELSLEAARRDSRTTATDSLMIQAGLQW